MLPKTPLSIHVSMTDSMTGSGYCRVSRPYESTEPDDEAVHGPIPATYNQQYMSSRAIDRTND